MLERLATLSADHFQTDPDEIHWGHDPLGARRHPEPLPRPAARDHRHGLRRGRTRRLTRGHSNGLPCPAKSAGSAS
jgi:hypothetical protein